MQAIVVAATLGVAAPHLAAQNQPGPPPPGTAAPAAVPSTGPATAPSTAPTSRPAVPARADVAGDLNALHAVLVQPDARPADREQAAARLVSRDRPEADDILRSVLAGDVREAKLAVARALVDDPTPSDAFVGPLLETLRAGVDQRSINLVDAAAQALAGYRGNATVVDELVRFATDDAQPPDARARIARALGRVVEPESAGALVRMLTVRAPVRTAAADALADMTGNTQFGADAGRWTAWLQANAGLMANNRDGWRAQMLEARAARLDRIRRRHEALVDTLDERVAEQYKNAAPDQRGAVLLALLNSEQPDERAAAANFVPRAFRQGDPVSEAVRARLTAMVGDSDAAVRYEVASTLRDLNHRPALGAELTQLAQERDERVKVVLIDAVGLVADPAAPPQLAAVLLSADATPRVFMAAAAALAKSGRDLKRTDEALWDRVTDRLRQVARRSPTAEVRGAALEALGALQDPGLPELAQVLLLNQPDPSVPVRQAALRALGMAGSQGGTAAAESAAIVTRSLRKEAREPAVRWAALDALARVGNLPEHGGLLLEYTSPRTEPDEGVRQKAWEAFQSLLPRATPAQINVERNGLKSDPVKLAVVLEEMCRQLDLSARPQDRKDLANFRVELGDVYVKDARQDPARAAKAIANYRAALDYYFREGEAENVTVPLIQQLMNAHLASKDYAAAARFAEEMIRRDQKNQETVGPAIRNEADRLRTDTNSAGSLQLINEALKMDPRLDDVYQRDLRQIRQDIVGQ